MRDFATSDHPRVQAQLDRLGALSVPDGRLGLETIRALLSRLGDPHLRLPPVFHVAGTNGKGSTCAFLRAMLEAEGYRVHATISPHLVRYNERIRLAGKLIDNDRLADVLTDVLDLGHDLKPSFFEVTIAAAFAEFARVPADVCVVEVGLGGRFDATNVLEQPAVCGIAALGLDHERFLLAPEDGVPTVPLERIAFEKAGIAKPGVPLVTQEYATGMTKAVLDQAMRAGARPALRELDWFAELGETIAYRDRHGELSLPLPALAGPHQADNAALAVAMLRHQSALTVSEASIRDGLAAARWPARLQRLSAGPLTGDREVWLDGGHNPSAGQALAAHFAATDAHPAVTSFAKAQQISLPSRRREGLGVGPRQFHLIIGMLANKDPAALTGPLSANAATISAVPVPTHEWHPASAFGPKAIAFPDVSSALAALPQDGLPVLIAGSLYLAGEVLKLNGEVPD